MAKNPVSLSTVLDRITPATPGISDKFSHNLARWVRRQSMRFGPDANPRVFCLQEQGAWDPAGTAQRQDIILGSLFDGDLIGTRLVFILQGRMGTWSYSRAAAGALDVTDDFLREYLARGRCFFDNHHTDFLMGKEGRYRQDGPENRTCAWCGVSQTLRLEHLVTERDHLRWRDAV